MKKVPNSFEVTLNIKIKLKASNFLKDKINWAKMKKGIEIFLYLYFIKKRKKRLIAST